MLQSFFWLARSVEYIRLTHPTGGSTHEVQKNRPCSNRSTRSPVRYHDRLRGHQNPGSNRHPDPDQVRHLRKVNPMSKEKSRLSIWRTGGFFVFVDKLADCSTAWIIDLFFEQDKRMLSNQGAGGCCPSTAVESGVSAPWAAQAGKICLDSGLL